MSGTYIPVRAALRAPVVRVAQGHVHSCFAGMRAGDRLRLSGGTFAHWFQWLLPVSPLLYLMIVVPTALWCGFWQAVIVSFSAMVVQAYFTAHQPSFNPVTDPANSVTLLAFVLMPWW